MGQGVDRHLRDSSDNTSEGASCSRPASRFAPSGPRPFPPLSFILLETLWPAIISRPSWVGTGIQRGMIPPKLGRGVG